MKSGIIIEQDEEHITAETINAIRLPGQNRRQSNSIVAMNSSLFSTHNILDSTAIFPPKTVEITSDHKELSSPLSLVGNAKKYSITQAKAKDRQIAKLTQRSILQSRRDYGEVYVRHRVNYFIFNI